MNQRIVITGMGAITPVGLGVEAYWQGLLDGQCGVRPIVRDDAQSLPVQAAAQVPPFDPAQYMDARLAAQMEPFMRYAYLAAEQAISDSGLDAAGNRTGVVMASALAGLTLTGDTQRAMDNGVRVGPRFLTKVMANIAAAQLSIQHRITGPSLTVSTACSSGGDAIVVARMLLQSGMADAVIVLAGESAVSPLLIHSLSKAGALSKTGQSRPFDCARNGFVIGEGGGALVLETQAHALSRGARIHAELAGCGNTADAYHTVSPHPQGEGAAECMRIALRDAQLSPEQIGYLNAHGTATGKGDLAETAAVREVFGEHPVAVSSTKGATGHMMGAGGVTEVIACIKAIQTGLIPHTVGCTQPDPECAMHLVTGEPLRRRVDAAMSNALGFGGQNSCIIVRRYTS